jgi:carbon monoxide dehydrogenase subunit G
MKVELEKTFPMPGTVEASWEFLQNVAGVAGCMPGAKITERVDDTHYKGTIAVRVGPAGMSFKGEIVVEGVDAATRTLHLVGKGSDTSGTSGASMDLVARIEPGATEGTSNLVGRSEVTMSGKAAAFGGRMMGSVADQILKQFAGNFATQVQARSAASATPPTTAPDSIATLHSRAAGSSNTAAGSNAPAATEAPSQPLPVLSPAPPAPANELNALALFWAILRDWFRGLFRRKPA